MSFLYSAREPMIRVLVREDPTVHWAHRYSDHTACGINKMYAEQPGQFSYKRVATPPTCLVCVAVVEC